MTPPRAVVLAVDEEDRFADVAAAVGLHLREAPGAGRAVSRPALIVDGDEIAACLLGSTDVAQPMEVRVIAGPAGLVAVAPEPVLARVRRLVEREPDPIMAFVEILSLLAAGCEDAQEEMVDGATELSGTLGGLHSAEPRRVARARNTFLAAGSTAAQTYQMLGDVLPCRPPRSASGSP